MLTLTSRSLRSRQRSAPTTEQRRQKNALAPAKDIFEAQGFENAKKDEEREKLGKVSA